MDPTSLSISVVGTALTLLLVYYGFRTLKLFTTNIEGRAWAYISMGAVFFVMGLRKNYLFWASKDHFD